MKIRILFSVLASSFLAMGVATSAHAEYLQLPERVFAPVGFDTNDNSQVVLYGHFPDTCFQAGPAEALINGHDITIRNRAHRTERETCVKAPVPWTTVVHLGSLEMGTYRISVEAPNGRAIPYANLEVFPNRSKQADDLPYAYVNGAIVNRTGLSPVLTISGSFNLTCMEMADVLVRETAGTIVILPVVRLRKDEVCGHPFVPIPFTKSIVLHPKTNKATLIHIRSVNGQALNQVIEN